MIPQVIQLPGASAEGSIFKVKTEKMVSKVEYVTRKMKSLINICCIIK